MTNDLVPHADASATDPSLLSVDPAAAAAPSTEPTPEPEEPAKPSFAQFNLDPDVQLALDEMGYMVPTPVQVAAYQPVREGKDLLVQARTGTGKTTAFGLPIVQGIDAAIREVQSLILAPTRELALQVSRELTQLGKHRGVIVEPIYGGAPIGKQITNLRNGVHIVVGTPGRVLDHIGRRTLDLRHVRIFVLDECDEMLSMGFLEDIERVVAYLSKDRQTMLFSATMPDEVTRFARRQMKTPEKIELSSDGISVADIHHAYYIVSGIAKTRDLLRIIHAENPESAIIFCNMRDETAMVARYLQKQGLDAEPISSDLSQSERERVMKRTKDKNLRFLVATDVAARGIDISDLSHVINFSFPESPEVYVHRTGRTGRAGKKGTALSLIGPRDLGSFYYLRLSFKIKPEERMLPPWAVLEGKLKQPLPAIGAPKKPDPVAIVSEAVKGPASDADLDVVKKLMATPDGERVLAVLVRERVAQLIKPKQQRRERPEWDRGDRSPHSERDFADRDDRGGRDRPRFGRDRDDRGGGGGGGDRGERPRWGRDRDDRGPREGGGEDRPRWGRDRDDRGPRPDDRGPRPEGQETGRWRRERDGGEVRAEARPEGERHEVRDERPAHEGREERPREDRPREDRGERDRERGHRDRDRGERRDFRDRGERGDRPRREDRDDRPRRDDRDDRPRRDAAPTVAQPMPFEAAVDVGPSAIEPTAEAVDAALAAPVAAPAEAREDRPDRAERDRDRNERRERRDRERDERRARRTTRDTEVTAAVPADEPAAAAEAPPAREPRGEKKAKNGTDQKEFWETWADEKSTRVEPAPAAAPARDRDKPEGRRKKDDDGGGRDRGRARKDDRGDRPERGERKAEERKPDAKPAIDPSGQVRLYVSLGKSHDASAGDVRALLAKALDGDITRIGSVMLRDSHSYVKVPADLADSIIAAAHGTKHGDVEVTVERARA